MWTLLVWHLSITGALLTLLVALIGVQHLVRRVRRDATRVRVGGQPGEAGLALVVSP